MLKTVRAETRMAACGCERVPEGWWSSVMAYLCRKMLRQVLRKAEGSAERSINLLELAILYLLASCRDRLIDGLSDSKTLQAAHARRISRPSEL